MNINIMPALWVGPFLTILPRSNNLIPNPMYLDITSQYLKYGNSKVKTSKNKSGAISKKQKARLLREAQGRRTQATNKNKPRRKKFIDKVVYADYIKSKEWLSKSKAFRLGANCKRCKTFNDLICHHKTYKNLGHETSRDICVLCVKCHESFHAFFGVKHDMVYETDEFIKTFDENK